MALTQTSSPFLVSKCPAPKAATSLSQRWRKSLIGFPFPRVKTSCSGLFPAISSRSSGSSRSPMGTMRGCFDFVENFGSQTVRAFRSTFLTGRFSSSFTRKPQLNAMMRNAFGHFSSGPQAASIFSETSRPFHFGVKSLGPRRSAVHLKSDYDLREPSCPQQERM